MIRITKLHLILMMLVVIASGAFLFQMYQENLHAREEAARITEERNRLEAERAKQELLLKQEAVARSAIAIAGEFWCLYMDQGRDVSTGQATLHTAKENFKQKNFEAAYSLSAQAIRELREAPLPDVYHIVRHGDNLWRIAAKPEYFHDGFKWRLIYQANKNIIHNPRRIFPHQKLLIPIHKKICEPTGDFNNF
jgi:nucleoid-associated protein YgaU